MKKPIFIILGIAAGIICCFVMVLYLFLKPFDEVYKENPVRKTLILSNKKEVFLRALYRGITGDYEEIVFSETPITIPDKEKNYIFYTSDIFYKIENDSIITIYAPESSISEPFNKFTNTTVKIVGLKNADEIKDYALNYQKYGLQKISVYQ
ncbi:MAG: hypothetical protein KA536_10240 [Saprospiraceae bacterium]|nr:hypothetical protein [Saprospiraceae bacterium]